MRMRVSFFYNCLPLQRQREGNPHPWVFLNPYCSLTLIVCSRIYLFMLRRKWCSEIFQNEAIFKALQDYKNTKQKTHLIFKQTAPLFLCWAWTVLALTGLKTVYRKVLQIIASCHTYGDMLRFKRNSNPPWIKSCALTVRIEWIWSCFQDSIHSLNYLQDWKELTKKYAASGGAITSPQRFSQLVLQIIPPG